MSDLPSRQWFRDHAGVMLNDTDDEGMEEWAIVAAYASGRLVDREAMTPMRRQGGMSGAWYREKEGYPPDGWLAIEDAT